MQMYPTILKAPKYEGQHPGLDILASLEGMGGTETVQIAAETPLSRPEETAAHVYLVRSGQLVARNERGLYLWALAQGDVIGALAVWTGQRLPVQVTAETDVELLAVPADTFRSLLKLDADLREMVGATMRARMQCVQLAAVLAGLFEGLDDALLATISAAAEWHYLGNGDTLFRAGERSDALYLLINGRLQWLIPQPDGRQQTWGTVSAGEALDLNGLLSGEPHAMTAVATRETTLISLSYEVCRQLWREHPQLLFPLAQQDAQRRQKLLTATTTFSIKPTPPATITLVPASGQVDIATFAAALAEAMQPYGATAILDRSTVDAVFGQKGTADIPHNHPAHELLVARLNNLESEYQRLIYVADPIWSEWTRRSLRQADRVLIVADAAADPAPTLIEEAVYALPTCARVDLVLWHPPQTERPRATAHWLTSRSTSIHAYYHVRRGTAAHIESLARRLTGKAIALVLSGGAAKGYAHLGVMRALEQLNIPVDLIGGTSMGALMGGAFAFDMDFAGLYALSTRLANSKALFDYTLPLVSLMASGKVTQILTEQVGDVQIEDLWRPYFAVTADLTAADIRVHERGPLWLAVRASLSIPGVFSPVLDADGHLLVDGGAINNFPIDVMRERVEGGTIIGVNVSKAESINPDFSFGPSISGWQVLWSRLNPLAPAANVPSLGNLLVRSVMLNNRKLLSELRQAADLLIEPDTGDVGSLQFERYAEMSEAGFAAAEPLLRDWWESVS